MSVVIPSLRGAIAVPGWAKNELWRKARAVPSLDLRFADNKSLVDAVTGASLVTFTRSGNGTYTDSAGVLQTAATDVPRFDHNPITGESLGFLVEEQRTNLLLRSEEFGDASWGKPNSDTITANSIISPDGTQNADTFDETSATSLHTLFQDVTVVGGTTYTLSFFAKAAGRSIIQFRLVAADDSNGVVSEFNISTGSIATAAVAIGTGGNASSSITSFGNGWYRCITTGSMGASVTGCRIRIRTLETAGGSTSITGLNGAAYYIWGAQLE